MTRSYKECLNYYNDCFVTIGKDLNGKDYIICQRDLEQEKIYFDEDEQIEC